MARGLASNGVDAYNIGMAQGRDGFRFTTKAGHDGRMGLKFLFQHFDGNGTAQRGINRLVDDAHPSRTGG